jgi:hypothetical protein
LSGRRKVGIGLLYTVGVLFSVAIVGIFVAIIATAVSDAQRVQIPASAAGMPRRTDKPALQEATTKLSLRLVSQAILGPKTGVYSGSDDPTGGIAIAAGSTPPFLRSEAGDPNTLLYETVGSFTSDAQISGNSSFDPGPRGGTLLCTSASGGSSPGFSLCAWRDDRTAGLALSYDEDAATLAGNLAVIRTVVEK